MRLAVTIILSCWGFLFASCSDAGSNPPPPPEITGMQPDSATVGDVVRVLGKGFGTTRSTSTVTFGGASASSFPSWSESEIQVVVPPGASTGSVVVTVNATTSNAFPFTVRSSSGSGGVSFVGDVQPILNMGCALSGCHRPPSPSSGFDQSTYVGVRAGGSKFGTSVVVAGDSTNSRIIQAMRGSAPGLGRMPFGGPWASTGVPDSLITTIAVWIQEGGLNN